MCLGQAIVGEDAVVRPGVEMSCVEFEKQALAAKRLFWGGDVRARKVGVELCSLVVGMRGCEQRCVLYCLLSSAEGRRDIWGLPAEAVAVCLFA